MSSESPRLSQEEWEIATDGSPNLGPVEQKTSKEKLENIGSVLGVSGSPIAPSSIDQDLKDTKSVRKSVSRLLNWPPSKRGEEFAKLKARVLHNSGVLSLTCMFLAGLVSFCSTFQTVDAYCQSDASKVGSLFLVFVGMMTITAYLQITKKNEKDVRLRLTMFALVLLTNFVVFFSSYLFLECDNNPHEDDLLKAASIGAHVILIVGNMLAVHYLFNITYSGALSIATILLHALAMLATGSPPFTKLYIREDLSCPADARCIKEESDPGVLRGWLKNLFSARDDSGVSCSRRSRTTAGRALLASLVDETGHPHDYFPIDKTFQ